MFQRFWEIVKKYPYLIGGAVLAGAILIWLLTRDGGEEETAPVYPGLDPGLLTAQMSLAGRQIEANSAAAIAQIQANIQSQEITAQTTLGQSFLESQIEQLALVSKSQFDLTAFQKEMFLFESAQQTERLKTETEGIISLANITTQGDITLGEQQLELGKLAAMLQALSQSFIATTQTQYEAWGQKKGRGKKPPMPILTAQKFEEMFMNILRISEGYQPLVPIYGKPEKYGYGKFWQRIVDYMPNVKFGDPIPKPMLPGQGGTGA
ncbi:MAG: hypothetical protein ACREBU_01500 [Nitrososphaera sp.]